MEFQDTFITSFVVFNQHLTVIIYPKFAYDDIMYRGSYFLIWIFISAIQKLKQKGVYDQRFFST